MKKQLFPVAILQGRLSPDIDNRYQFFPKEKWQDEFKVAHDMGFNGIEWLIDPKEWKDNPIFNESIGNIEKLKIETGCPIVSVCADWFMEVCIWEGDPEFHREKIRSLFPVLEKTVQRLLLVPILETHDLRPIDIQKKVVDVLKPLSSELEERNLHIGFETELTAEELIIFLDQFKSDAFGVYYDIGNCTSYGFNCSHDVQKLGNRIKGIHMKDRKIGTTKSLPLGEGDADYKSIFSALVKIKWQGTLVMQAWRGKDYIEDACKQLEFIKRELSQQF